MKISKSEKILMIVLLTVIVVGGYYKFINVNESHKIEVLRAEKKSYDDKLQDIKLKISMSNKKEKDIKILNSKVQNETSSIYPVIQQDRLIIELDALLKKSNVEGDFSFSANNVAEAGNKTINNGTTDTSKDMSKNTKDLKALQTIVDQYNNLDIYAGDNKKEIKGSTQYTQVSLAFKGSYDNIIGLIKNIENYNKKIIMANLALNVNDTGEISGTANLEFYSIPKFNGMDTDYFKWNYNSPYGKNNPFVSNGTSGESNVVKSNDVSTTIEEASKVKKNINDFAMSVRSVSSDSPAVMVGSYNDKDRKTYVYGDENIAEAVEISFVEVGGKFYYKYKVGSDSYPKGYSGNGTQFTPSNKDISTVIFSNKRISAKDNVGVNISVINKTSRVVNMYVSNDDAAKPRVTIKGEGSTVNIKNQ
ncbi:hypothetical protein LL037_22045 [Clostridium estertheticum]|uniref:hypothetical protein n=1 Tax=Clostridium estertheticum TaxID=238834 RepID=UPI001C0C85CB|nr:hypothetical protein [Clostridium estertheticum]MBU3198427.1 hypothetical protein [Clostridium estertheticum]WAG65108.1 hypothetical protein LL037_22045 [Clostridium estertheticum]